MVKNQSNKFERSGARAKMWREKITSYFQEFEAKTDTPMHIVPLSAEARMKQRSLTIS